MFATHFTSIAEQTAHYRRHGANVSIVRHRERGQSCSICLRNCQSAVRASGECAPSHFLFCLRCARRIGEAAK